MKYTVWNVLKQFPRGVLLKGFLQICSKLNEKQSHGSIISKEMLWRTPFLKNISRRLILKFSQGSKNSLYVLRDFMLERCSSRKLKTICFEKYRMSRVRSSAPVVFFQNLCYCKIPLRNLAYLVFHRFTLNKRSIYLELLSEISRWFLPQIYLVYLSEAKIKAWISENFADFWKLSTKTCIENYYLIICLLYMNFFPCFVFIVSKIIHMLPYPLEKIQNVLHQNAQMFFSWSMQEKMWDNVLIKNFLCVTM